MLASLLLQVKKKKKPPTQRLQLQSNFLLKGHFLDEKNCLLLCPYPFPARTQTTDGFGLAL